MNTSKSLMTVAAVAVLLSGCASHQYYTDSGKCVTCINNPFTGKPLNYDASGQKTVANGTSGVAVTTGSQTGTITVHSSLDVDTAAARVKDAFSFMTPDEMKASAGGGMGGQMAADDPDLMYSSSPGSFYSMQGVYALNNAGSHHILQRAKVSKNGSGSTVTYSWHPAQGYNEGSYNGSAVKSFLTNKLNSALK